MKLPDNNLLMFVGFVIVILFLMLLIIILIFPSFINNFNIKPIPLLPNPDRKISAIIFLLTRLLS